MLLCYYAIMGTEYYILRAPGHNPGWIFRFQDGNECRKDIMALWLDKACGMWYTESN